MNIWGRVSIVAGLVGLIVANAFLPNWLQGTLLAVYLVAGPGAALCAWVRLPLSLSLLVAPITGPALVVLYGAFAARVVGWDPLLSLAVASFLTVLSGILQSLVAQRATRTAAVGG